MPAFAVYGNPTKKTPTKNVEGPRHHQHATFHPQAGSSPVQLGSPTSSFSNLVKSRPVPHRRRCLQAAAPRRWHCRRSLCPVGSCMRLGLLIAAAAGEKPSAFLCFSLLFSHRTECSPMQETPDVGRKHKSCLDKAPTETCREAGVIEVDHDDGNSPPERFGRQLVSGANNPSVADVLPTC